MAGGLAGGMTSGGMAIAGGAAGGTSGGDAGGSAGGAAGGSAGGAAGGSAGGAVVGGGTAGGTMPVPTCPSNCPDYATCEADFDGGRCINLTVTIVAPANGAVFDAGGFAPMRVDARLRDGGLWPIRVPYQTSYNVQGFHDAGSLGALALPSVAGIFSLTAGWDGGPSADVQLQTLSCTRGCAPWESCRATTDGGVCESLQLTLTWLSPDAGSPHNGNTVPATLRVTSTRGPVPATVTSIPLFKVAPGTEVTPLTGGPPTYGTQLPMTGPEGATTFIAGWRDGGPTTSLSIVRDTEPPIVTLYVTPRDTPSTDPLVPNTLKRGDTAFVRVDITGGLPVTTSNFWVVDAGPVALSLGTPAECGCFNPGCQCLRVPLVDVPEFWAMPFTNRDPIDPAYAALAFANIRDEAGNRSDGTTPIQISAHLWTADATTAGVASDGTVVTATGISLAAYELDGGQRWLVSADPTGKPVVGAANVYTIESNAIVRRSLATGAENGRFCEVAGDPPRHLALAETAFGVEVPVAERGRRAIVAPSCSQSKVFGEFTASNVIQLIAERDAAGNLLITMLGDNGQISRAAYNGLDFLEQDGGVVLESGATSLFVTQHHLGFLKGNAFALRSLTDLSIQTSGTANGAQRLAAADILFGNLSTCFYTLTGIQYCDPRPAWGPQGLAAGGRVISTHVTQGNLADSYLSHDADGGIYPLAHTPRGSEILLDVGRTATGAKDCSRPSRLYVLHGGKVSAYEVDTRGLDTTAPWPLPNHDSANSNFAQRSLAPWSCP